MPPLLRRPGSLLSWLKDASFKLAILNNRTVLAKMVDRPHVNVYNKEAIHRV